jgi:hypothetical protein
MTIINKQKEKSMIAVMMVKMREMVGKIRSGIDGILAGVVRAIHFNPMKTFSVLMLLAVIWVLTFTGFGIGNASNLKKNDEIARLRLRVMDLSGVVSLLEAQGDVLRRQGSQAMEYGEKKVRIEAVKAGVGKWVVIDDIGTVEFQWIKK